MADKNLWDIVGELYQGFGNNPNNVETFNTLANVNPLLAAYRGAKTLSNVAPSSIAKALRNEAYGINNTADNRAAWNQIANIGSGIADVAPMAATVKPAIKPTAQMLGRELARQIETGTGFIGKNTINPKANILPPEKYQGGLLTGMPHLIDVGGGKLEPFGTDRRIVDTAQQYMADQGLSYNPQTKYTNVDSDFAKRLADAYQHMKDNPSDPAVKKSYDALINQTMAQYEAARKAGQKFEFMPQGQDLYGNPRNAINDIVTNQHMYVFPTEEGFGSLTEAQAANPLLQKTGEKWNGKDVTANDLFRAVHDYYGHAKHGVGFRATGEENAFQSHAKMFTPEALPALTSETRGQNSWVNYGPHGEFNRTTNPSNTIYADQKSGILPEWAWLERIIK